MIGPRTDFLTWDDTWMAIAHVIARRSKDPSTQVGAVIVDVSNNILGIGYNGLPRGCDSNKFPWNRTGNCLDTKYMYVSHAEANAIDNSNRSRIKGSKIYTTLFPCNMCAIRIIQNGISSVIYFSDKYNGTSENTAAKRLFSEVGISVQKFNNSIDNIFIDINNK